MNPERDKRLNKETGLVYYHWSRRDAFTDPEWIADIPDFSTGNGMAMLITYLKDNSLWPAFIESIGEWENARPWVYAEYLDPDPFADAVDRFLMKDKEVKG